MKRFSKWAGELGFEYNLVDAGWSNWEGQGRDSWDMIRELVDYSAPLGVKIWVWKAYPDDRGVEWIQTPERLAGIPEKMQGNGCRRCEDRLFLRRVATGWCGSMKMR